ncbi:ankyrin repeat-containing protein BDA1-like [Mangifera indica]|uniref:ankyrin repeat-containing protein BDA1-like n=1 Tax=Mangifera indica TaxID=29780 RepID=UPI001CFA5C41|nr:ankyrin repeat-containing protein BDA1-like [Mangifera indica]
MVTPLHYAVKLDDESSLADFLYVCPLSIEDLTVKSETAVHVTLKNGSLKAFKVLLGWLQCFNKEEILKWEDEEGNNALHTAVSANQPEMAKLLIGYMNVNIKNRKVLTALDIFYDRQGQGLVDAAVGDILLAAKAKSASQLHHPSLRDSRKISLVEYFSGGLSFSARIAKRFSQDFSS